MSRTKRIKKKTPATARKRTGPLLISPFKLGRKDLTDDQRDAFDLFYDWFYSRKTRENQILRIGGSSGTGKSVLIEYIVNSFSFSAAECYVMAYTGQAVNRLRTDGILANTIHSVIMNPVDEIIINKKTGEPYYRRGVPLTKTRFRPVKYLPSSTKLLIIDEASFLPESMERTLAEYNIPILEIGDPLQIGPVGGIQVFRESNMDFFMNQIMRQCKDSEIIDFATRLRYGLNIYTERYHDDVLFLKQQETVEDTFSRFLPFFRGSDAIITVTNKQRQTINELYRRKIIHAKSPYPCAGERLICRRNNWSMAIDQFMLTNGTQGTCMATVGRSLVDDTNEIYYMDFMPDVTADTGKMFDNLPCDAEHLLQPVTANNRMEAQYAHPGEKFEYAYALTSFLLQGSTVGTALFMDGYWPDEEQKMRIRYTAATRPKTRLIYMKSYSRYDYFELANIEFKRQVEEMAQHSNT